VTNGESEGDDCDEVMHCNGSGELVIGVADCNIRSINTS